MGSSIQKNASNCLDAFAGLLAAATSQSSPSSSLVNARDVDQLQERFKQWAGNLGAFQPPNSHLSLEHRLGTSPKIQDAIVGMLQDLFESAQAARDIISGQRVNRIAEPVADLETDLDDFDISSSDSDCSASSDLNFKYEGKTSEIEQLMLAIKLSLDNLFKASMFIRKFSPKDRRRERALSTKPFNNQPDAIYIQDRYPRLVGKKPDSEISPLVARLAEANARRRQYFKYCRDHHDRLSIPRERLNANLHLDRRSQFQFSGPGLTVSGVSNQIGSTLMADTDITEFVAPDLQDAQLSTLLAEPQAKSVASFATTILELSHDEVLFPSLPTEAQSNASFLCPYCLKIVALKVQTKEHQWKQHVLKDLAPYVCTFRQCSLRLYDSQHSWFEHELQMHRVNWVCRVCNAAFDASTHLTNHIRASHNERVPENQIVSMVEQSRRPMQFIRPSECPFCDEDWALAGPEGTASEEQLVVDLNQFQRHLGHHLERVALFSLPRLNHVHELNSSRPCEDLDRDDLPPSYRWVRDDCGRGWSIISNHRATFIAFSSFLSLHRKIVSSIDVTNSAEPVSSTSDDDLPPGPRLRLGQTAVSEASGELAQYLSLLSNSSATITMRWRQNGPFQRGTVCPAINLDTNHSMAVKQVRFSNPDIAPLMAERLIREVSILEMLDHPNIVGFYGIEVHQDGIYIFMEYCSNGSIEILMERGRIEDEQVILVYALQLLEGLAYLHGIGISHRNITPENILLDHNGVIKYINFSLATPFLLEELSPSLRESFKLFYAKQPHGNPGPSRSMTGTPQYMSPELITGNNPGKSGAVDIWSLGCVILEMATGQRPWHTIENEWAIMYNIAQGGPPPLPTTDQLSAEGIDFLTKCFTKSPEARPTAVELLQHDWIAAIRNKITESLTPSDTRSDKLTSKASSSSRKEIGGD